MKQAIFLVALVMLPGSVCAVDLFGDDWEERAESISEGELIWHRQTAANKPPLTALNIKLLETSATDGWVAIYQCHNDLNSVPAAELVFPDRPVRKLRVEKTANIGSAVISQGTVQLEDVRRGGSICVHSEQQVFHRLDQHHWALINGPFQRRFLDGYYPVRLSITVKWQANKWRYVGSRPDPGPVISSHEDRLQLEATFSGKLKTGLIFQHAL